LFFIYDLIFVFYLFIVRAGTDHPRTLDGGGTGVKGPIME